jgi:DNA helicase IV
VSYTDALREEESNKEKIYASFETEVKDLIQREGKIDAYFKSGAYEEQDAANVANTLLAARRATDELEQKVKLLLVKPYFAHIRMRDKNDGDGIDCFLSDNEYLNAAISVSDDPSMMIIPFKQDKQRPFFTAAFHCYQAKTDETIPVITAGDHRGSFNRHLYQPELIRDVEVKQRQILDIVTYLPQDDGEDHVVADDLLAEKLAENRNDVKLRNIIATLQLQQFDIIRTDSRQSFVVQGCAGSGKTQSLIHRLFFLRDVLRDSGWQKVLLITPTQLFRNYASGLIRRYHLESVANMSLASLYRMLLEQYDQRFSSRQYLFELSEEYLPDTYLQQVYAHQQIERIDAEIARAIKSYVADGCRLTDVAMPQDAAIDSQFVNMISEKLALQLKQYDEKEQLLAEDAEYLEHRRELDKLDKNLASCQKTTERHLEANTKLRQEKASFELLLAAYQAARADIDDQAREEKSIVDFADKLKQCIQKIERCQSQNSFHNLMTQYARLRRDFLDKIKNGTDDEQFIAEYKALLDSIDQENTAALFVFTKNQTPADWQNAYKRRLAENEKRLREAAEEQELINLYIEDHNTWLREHSLEDAQNQRQAYRAELERCRYYLGRIESSVFEREVWNALAPLKTECGIQTIYTEQLSNGRQKQSRILYKSDLLFYLKIYNRLHRQKTITEYDLICIDEGQDLHSADYDLIKSIYPKAALNVFGDTEQVLHEACGIRDWRSETGIEKLFEMNNNYRNNAAIAEFCNANFASKMKYFGKISSSKQPQKLPPASNIDKQLQSEESVVIVKNEQMFHDLLSLIHEQNIQDKLIYVDTKAEEVPEQVIPCYSVFAAKGLEFKRALVYAKDMTKNQKVVACTRAMDELIYIG